jgi:hypothetical protein
MNWRSFLILHGVENWRPREHWQWWLAHELRARGEQAFYPQLPAPSSPALDERTSPEAGHLRQGEDVLMGGEQQQQRNPRRLSEEGKRDAVNLVRSTGRPIAAVARELGIYDSTLGTGCPRAASTVARPRG